MILYSQVLDNNEKETFKISFECNQNKVDTRMIFHALQQKTNVVVCSKDTNVLVLMIFVYALDKINEKQVKKIKSNKFVNILKIVEYLGTGVATKLPKSMQLQGVIQLLFYMFL